MLAYVMVGTNNLKRSGKFYDAALAPLGLVRMGDSNRYFGYGPKSAPQKSQVSLALCPLEPRECPRQLTPERDDIAAGEIGHGCLTPVNRSGPASRDDG